MIGRRDQVKDGDGPGPGQYEPQEWVWLTHTVFFPFNNYNINHLKTSLEIFSKHIQIDDLVLSNLYTFLMFSVEVLIEFLLRRLEGKTYQISTLFLMICCTWSCVWWDICVCFRDHTALYENVNLRREQRGRPELILPRYHELIAQQEEKKVNTLRIIFSRCFF